MHELMFQAGVKGMSERSELITCLRKCNIMPQHRYTRVSSKCIVGQTTNTLEPPTTPSPPPHLQTCFSVNANSISSLYIMQVVFPIEKQLRLRLVDDSLQNKTKYSMFWALVLKNGNNDTPLTIAIDNNHPK